MKKQLIYVAAFTALIFASCSKETPIDIDDQLPKEAKKLLVLNEGGMGHNNSTLALYDLTSKKLDNNYFASVNNRGLGDIGNYMIKHGSKIYVVVTGSNTLEIIDANSGKSLKRLGISDGLGQQPRKIAASGQKVYITSFDDTVTRIDTLTLSIDGSVAVGRDPEGIAIKNNKIYVANSGGLDYETGNFDSTVSVIDASTFKEEKKIEVGKNPVHVFADSQGDIYVATSAIWQGWTKVADASFKKINATTGKVETIGNLQPNKFTIVNDKAYIIIDDYSQSLVTIYDCITEKVSVDNFISDGTKIPTPYHLSVDTFSGDVFLTETDYTTPGNVHCFDKNGKLKYTLKAVGINPTFVAFLN